MTNTNTQDSPTVDAQWLRSALEGSERPTVLDVRSSSEFESAHIDGATLVPVDAVHEHREALARDLDSDAVLICRSGARAFKAQEALAQAGLSGVRVLEGGMNAWESTGAPVRSGAPAASSVDEALAELRKDNR